MKRTRLLCSGLILLVAFALPTLKASELHIGAATVESTPPRPAPLAGQMHIRISEKVESPLFVSAIALESRDGDKVIDQAISVACDIVAIREDILEEVREKAKDKLPGFDLNKLFLNATHTHTAPFTRIRDMDLPEGVMTSAEYREFFTDRIVEAAVKSWETRSPGKVGWGQGQAVVAQNRRAVYADGSAKMYGKTDDPEFRGIEAWEDHNLDVLFFWDKKDKLIATVINIACPSQEVESRSAVNADFWDPVRTQLRERHGEDLHIIPWVGAAGDTTPHLMYGKEADERMRRLRGLTRLEEIARRVVRGWEEAYEVAKLEPFEGPVFEHRVTTIELPRRRPTEEEVKEALAEAKKYKDDPKAQPRYLWHMRIVELDQGLKDGSVTDLPIELHTLRLGDIAIGTNRFELFSDFGARMKARSPAIQTFIVQLAGPGGYLPTQRAVEGGSYSAIIQSNPVGPEGGQILVDRTVESWLKMWEEK